MKALPGARPDHVRAWRCSGESGREYCAKRGLNLHTLWSWSARTQDEKRPSSKASKPGTEVRMALMRPARSIEVTATPVAPVENGVRLRVGAVDVELERSFDGETLKEARAAGARRARACVMIPTDIDVFVALDPVSLHKSFDTLAGEVQDRMGRSPRAGGLEAQGRRDEACYCESYRLDAM